MLLPFTHLNKKEKRQRLQNAAANFAPSVRHQTHILEIVSPKVIICPIITLQGHPYPDPFRTVPFFALSNHPIIEVIEVVSYPYSH